MNEVLRHYWHAVATAEEIRERPVGVQLLGEELVVFRTGGRVTALYDLCLHRGARLSLGWVDGENLVCPYHGWCYGPDGACVRIPSLPPGREIPRKARTPAYRAEERYGLVWVCLDEPRAPIPPFPEADDPAFAIEVRRYDWRAHATRVVENVLDLSHFPWVHPGLLGDRSQPIGPDIAVEYDGDEMCYDVPHELTAQVRRYRLNLPFTVRIVRQPADPAVPDRRTIFLTHTPVADKQTLQFQILARNFGLDEPDDEFRTLNATIVAQDEPIVASQRPELLPTDLSAELHLRGPDVTAIEYRRALARLGI